MSTASIIGKVSEALKTVLLDELGENVTVTLQPPPGQGSGDRRVNLYLYKVQEHAQLKNLDWQVSRNNSGQIIPPPLSLTLFYLLTPYTTGADDSNTHTLLGSTMRVFSEHPVLNSHPALLNNDVFTSLTTTREEIRLMLCPPDLEELSKIWSTFSEPFRLSVVYEVSVVQIDTGEPEEIAPRVKSIGPPRVGSDFAPPSVDAIVPQRGVVGDLPTITVRGQNLAGHKARIYLADTKFWETKELGGDVFGAELPPDLVPALYPIRIDIGTLFRRTFLFEVVKPEEPQ